MSLARFREAQDRIWPAPVEELRAGRKATHWMWFVFPQLRGLGRSETARRFGIAGLKEARAYLADPVLGPRLLEAAAAMRANAGRAPEDVLGAVDALKLRSSATLFAMAAEDPAPFRALLETFHAGEACPATRDMLKGEDR
ncbi:DUF1810 domain-containing protein [Rhodosalinus sp. FB01]|uniref:DUF1810 domain-containing protein n=1 Tax=Rhodosalinus sp. FB01 TaxID=3239194 RepID=UPI00352570EA